MRSLYATIFGISLATLALAGSAFAYASHEAGVCRSDQLAASAWIATHNAQGMPTSMMPDCAKWGTIQGAAISIAIGGGVGTTLLGIALLRGRSVANAA